MVICLVSPEAKVKNDNGTSFSANKTISLGGKIVVICCNSSVREYPFHCSDWIEWTSFQVRGLLLLSTVLVSRRLNRRRSSIAQWWLSSGSGSSFLCRSPCSSTSSCSSSSSSLSSSSSSWSS